MPKLRHKLLLTGPFTVPLELYQGSRKKFCKRIKKFYGVDSEQANGRDGECFWIENKKTGDQVIIVWIDRQYDAALIVHELGHAVFDILHISGVPIEYDNQEVFTYLHGYLVGQAIDFLSS